MSYVPIDLISRISSNTMQDGLVASRVVLHPAIDAQNFALVDDYLLVISDEGFDLAAGEDSFSELSHGEQSSR